MCVCKRERDFVCVREEDRERDGRRQRKSPAEPEKVSRVKTRSYSPYQEYLGTTPLPRSIRGSNLPSRARCLALKQGTTPLGSKQSTNPLGSKQGTPSLPRCYPSRVKTRCYPPRVKTRCCHPATMPPPYQRVKTRCPPPLGSKQGACPLP